MTPELKQKILAATVGSKFGAILRCAMDVEKSNIPRFFGKATVTSDGFVMCNFVDSNGDTHYGAFVGSKIDVLHNTNGLVAHLDLDDKESEQLITLVDGWMAIEFRYVTSKKVH